MVKPNKEYLKNAENKARIDSMKLKLGVFTVGAVTAAVLGFGGQDSANAEENNQIKANPREVPVPNIVPENDARTADPWGVNQGEIAEEDIIEQSGKFFENQLTEDSKRDLSVPEGTKLGERQGVLKEGDIPEYTFTGASPQLDPQDYDDGVIHGDKGLDASEIPSESKGIRTWQNEDEDVSQMIKDRMNSRFDVSTKAQKEMASQLMKHIKSNSSDYD